jgi:hypothetical protein
MATAAAAVGELGVGMAGAVDEPVGVGGAGGVTITLTDTAGLSVVTIESDDAGVGEPIVGNVAAVVAIVAAVAAVAPPLLDGDILLATAVVVDTGEETAVSKIIPLTFDNKFLYPFSNTSCNG